MTLSWYRGAGTLGQATGGSNPGTNGGPTIPTAWSQTLVNGWGINTHLTYGKNAAGVQNAYQMTSGSLTADQTIAYAVDLCGASFIREVLSVGNTKQRNRVKALFTATGAQVVMCAAALQTTPTPPTGAAIATEILGFYVVGGQLVVTIVTGINEPDLSGDAGQVSKTQTLQTQLWASSLNGVIPIAGPPLGNPNSTYTAYGSFATGHCNIRDLHIYAGGAKPSTGIDKILTASNAMFGTTMGGIVTEGGYENALNFRGGNPPVPEDVAAVYYPRNLLEVLYRPSLTAFCGYELVDQYPDAALTSREHNFGLFHYDWTPKPAAIAMGRLINLNADPGATYTPSAPLGGKVSGGDASLRYLNFQKSDGTNLLHLWRDISIYNQSTTAAGTYVSPPPAAQTITVTLNNSATVAHYDVSANTASLNTTPTPTATTTGLTHTVALAGNLIVLAIK